MHNPVGLDSLRGLPPVENERFLHPDLLGAPGGEDGLVCPRGLPVS